MEITPEPTHLVTVPWHLLAGKAVALVAIAALTPVAAVLHRGDRQQTIKGIKETNVSTKLQFTRTHN